MHLFLRRLGLVPLLLLGLFQLPYLRAQPASTSTSTRPPLLETGELNGAKFTLARPAGPVVCNRQLLLIAHGYRDAKAPLVADLFPDQLAHQTLLAEGWIVAKTSYRRNGLIIADGLADLDALRAHIAETHGVPTRVVLEGESMGGLIVTLAAERAPALYAGGIGIGAALSIKEPASTLAPSSQPKIPLLFLTNQSELDGPAAYVATSAAHTAPTLRPVLFRVARDGHVNVNQRERLVALRALTTWLDSGRDHLPAPASGAPAYDATVVPAPVPSQITRDPDDRGFTARITEISSIYGNVFLNAQPADFAAAGIDPATWFQLTAHGQTYRTFYGTDFSSVKRGEWVVFPNADGYFWLSRNWENAATTAHLNLGDPVSIHRPDPQ
ncbi:MAG: alpha/beta hydrolase [Undibacterium sp.]|nr:alpha/beta hydrolase [Opitutaceae bacterium]